ncbi:hypothetical protein NP493_989g01026 [Ridgeia piscesae]|uniref:Secreted protein n=1 Tax=Ridgeia piscesae TaxID=27915 RepID=A0AAD9NM16_RIDPI|nr:hypothetical protein NP493_989g01026 [Ridgeia piscesae]
MRAGMSSRHSTGMFLSPVLRLLLFLSTVFSSWPNSSPSLYRTCRVRCACACCVNSTGQRRNASRMPKARKKLSQRRMINHSSSDSLPSRRFTMLLNLYSVSVIYGFVLINHACLRECMV